MRGVLDNAETVPRVGTEARWEKVQCAQAIRGDSRVASTQAVEETENVNITTGLGQRPRDGRADLLGDLCLNRRSNSSCGRRIITLLLGLGLCDFLATWKSDSLVEVNGGRNKVDVFFDVRRNTVSITANMRLSAHVHINVKLGLQ